MEYKENSMEEEIQYIIFACAVMEKFHSCKKEFVDQILKFLD